MKIHKRHLPLVHQTPFDMIGVRYLNGDGGDGGGAGGSGGSGNGSTGGSSSGNGGSGSGGGQGDGGDTGGRRGAGGGSGSGSGGAGNGSGSGGSGSSGSGGDAERRLESQPQWVQQLVRDLRDEAAGNRTKKNTAEQQMTDLQRKVAAAFGIDVDGDGKPDPDKLATDLARAQETARMRSVELAVYRSAGEKNADPVALLDSRTFLDSVAELDPAANDFQTRLGDKITQATQNNPRLAQSGTGGSTTGGAGRGIGQGGRGQGSGPTGVAAGRALHQERKGAQTNAASTT